MILFFIAFVPDNITYENVFENFEGDGTWQGLDSGLIWTKYSKDNNLPMLTNNPENVHSGNWAVELSGNGIASTVSYIEIDIEATENTNLSFWYKVSAESDGADFYDGLVFYQNGIEKGKWGSERPWHSFVAKLTKGLNTLRWQYVKDNHANSGQDKAWVDNITTDKPVTMAFVECKLTITISGEGNVKANGVNVESNIPIKFQKGVDVLLEAITTEPNVFIEWSGDAIGYTTPVTINMSNDKKIAATFIDSTTLPQVIDEGWETGDTSKYDWITGGNALPFVQNTEEYEGNYSIQFGNIVDNERSYFEILVNPLQDLLLKFWAKTSCESGNSSFWDGLEFFIDDMNIPIIQWGNNEALDWAEYYQLVPIGVHRLRWQFIKDNSGESGEDTAWVDNISLDVGQPEISIVNISDGGIKTLNAYVGNPNPVEKIIPITIRNIGYAGLDIGQIVLSNTTDFDIVTGENPSNTTIPAQKSDVLKLSITPTVIGQTYSTTVTIPHNGTNDTDGIYQFTLEVIGVENVTGWLFMMYMAGNSGLGDHLWEDVNEMEYGLYLLQQAGQFIDNIKILVLFDGESTSHPDNKLYDIGFDTTMNTKAGPNTLDLSNEKWWTGDVDTGDASTVTQFVNWSINRYGDFTNRMLILSNHGGGPDKEITREICSDSSSGNHIKTNQLRIALENAGFNSTNKLTILGMDACLMGDIEEAYEYRNVAGYFVASPKGEPLDGWEFQYWLPNITEDSFAEDIAYQIVLSYKQRYYPSETLTAVDLSKMETLKTSISELASQIITDGKESEAKNIMNTVHYYSISYLKEFGEFCNKLSTSTYMTPAIKNKATISATALGEAVIYAYAGTYDGNYEGYGSVIKRGLSVVSSIQSFYSSLQFSQSNIWVNFID